MPIHVSESTSFDCLWQRFECFLAEPLAEPLAKEVIVVPGRGWSTVLSRRLASHQGCWAQSRFLPFGQWMAVVLQEVLGAQLAPEREIDSLTWSVAKRLRGFLSDPDFRDLKNYLYEGGEGLDWQKLVDLARCIGRLFDRYLLDRPEMIDGWERGRDWPFPQVEMPSSVRWQRKLWQSIAAERSFRSVRAMTGDLDARLANRKSQLPQRVSIWVCGGVARTHLDFLEAVGRHIDVALFVLVPVTEFWGDMHGRRALLKKLRDSQMTLRQFCELEHVDVLHPLLASCGELSRQRQMLMVECEEPTWRIAEPLRDDQNAALSTSLLKSLQSAIRQATEPEAETLPFDRSLRIHSCHSALREVEVLHDQIRDAFEADPALSPQDVVVMCSDLETYAPLIHAVFGLTESGDEGHIPYYLAGRAMRQTRPVMDAYFRLLEFLQGRFEVGQLIDLLHIEAIGTAAGLTDGDVQEVGEWVIASQVRWGVDAAHRVKEGLPETDLNTWQFGLDRLLLGYAMPPGGQSLVQDVASLDRAAGLRGVTLGRFWAFVKRLSDWRERVQNPRSIEDWQPVFLQLAEQMLAPGEDEGARQLILDAIDHLVDLATAGGFDAPLPFDVVVREIAREVDEQSGDAGFRLSGVTFSDFAALRGLPFEVVAMLGMNDRAFPKSERPVRFDLIARAPQLGDRQPRHEDRHLFLEAILAAQSRLIVTYQGQGIRDQKPRPPSVLIDELLDVLNRSHLHAEGEPALRDRLVISHPLQAFSPRYFDGSNSEFFSFDVARQSAAQSLCEFPEVARAFVLEALPLDPRNLDIDEISIDQLRLMLIAPWRLFLKRLNLSLSDDDSTIQDREPLLLLGLDDWSVGDRWLKQRLLGATLESTAKRFERSGEFPSGQLGRAELERFIRKAETVLETAQKAGVTLASDPLRVNLMVGGRRLIGSLAGWTEQGLRRVTWSSLKMKYILGLWFDHLVATVVTRRGLESAVLVAKDRTLTLQPVMVGQAEIELARLAAHFDLATQLPLPFFPECIDASQLLKGTLKFEDPFSLDAILQKARKEFDRDFGPASNPGIKQAFAGRDPFALYGDFAPELEAEPDENLFLFLAESYCAALAQHV